MLGRLGYGLYAVEEKQHISRLHTLLQSSASSAPSSRSLSSVSSAMASGAASSSRQSRADPRELRRLTVEFDNRKQFDLMKSSTSPEMVQFDIIAAMPHTAEAFACACSRKDLDLISLDASSKLDFILRPELVLSSIKQGVFFELRYSGALQSSTRRQYFISNTAALLRASRGRGVILSSGASNPLELRGHHDLANLVLVCGSLGMETALECVAASCLAVIDRASTRRLAKAGKAVG